MSTNPTGMMSKAELIAQYERAIKNLIGRKGAKAATSRAKLNARLAELKAEA